MVEVVVMSVTSSVSVSADESSKSQSVRSGHSVVEVEVMPVITRTQPTLALKNRSTCSGRKVVKETVMVNQSVSGIWSVQSSIAPKN